jgi:hypothetical protein
MTFNDKIDLYMENNNYSNLKQLAKDCEIPYTTLRDFYEKKSADNSRLSTIRKLSNLMGCTMDYLAYDDVTDFKGYLTNDSSIPNTDAEYKQILRDKGLMDENDNINEEDFKKLIDFAVANKDFIIKKDKD